MKKIISHILIVCFLANLTVIVFAVDVMSEEMLHTSVWLKKHLIPESGKEIEPPFSFVYDGRSSAEFFSTCQQKLETRALDRGRKEHVITWTGPSGLAVKCRAIEYLDFPTVEWVLYFKNTDSEDTKILENIRAIDVQINRPGKEEFILHHHTGSGHAQNDFQPHQTVLATGAAKSIASIGGRPTNGALPYFNIEMPGEKVTIIEEKTAIWKRTRIEQQPANGVIVVVGWPGQWLAEFTRDSSDKLRIRAGQEKTRFKLHSGEEVRSPMIVLQFWKGDKDRSQNIWRKWMFEYNLPRPGGKLPEPQLTPCSSHQFNEMLNANEENQKFFIDRYVEEGLDPDYWWMDAGWYVNNGTWVNTGTWEVDKERFPRGLRAISDHAHAKGVKIILWFEPERVTENSWLWDNRPNWLLSATDVPANVGWMTQWKILDLGNDQARKWLIEHVDNLITEEGIDLYRQDFNVDPLYFWQNADTDDRQGITEIRYVSGYLAYWDELIRRHPDMLIDSCASGGRRNDLETMRRAVPFVRSDYIFEEIGQQSHSYAVNWWIPYHGTGVLHSDPYHFWSTMSPHITPCWDMRDKELDYELLRKLTKQWRQVGAYYCGDYYTLTPYSLSDDVWMAWQFDRADLGEGMVQAFRRPGSYTLSAEFLLRGLKPDLKYTVSELGNTKSQVYTGRELMEQGIKVTIDNRPGAVVVVYKKTSKSI